MSFIDSADCQQGMPPWSFPGVTMTDFVLPADPSLMQAYCDRVLNLDPTISFQVLQPFVHVGINQYPRMFSLYGNNPQLGFTSQNEYYVMFPVVRWNTIAGRVQAPREITWVFPFIGVDNPTSAISGHAVLGFPKLCGEIAVSFDADSAFTATADMPGFAPPLTTQSAQQILPLLSIQAPAPLANAPAAAGFPWTFLGLRKEAGELDAIAEGLLALVDPGLFSVTNLKQFRDALAPQNACYQALVRAEWRMENTQAPLQYEGAQIRIFDNATNRIVESLGVGGGGAQPFSAELGTSCTTDLWFGNVTNLLVLT